VIRYDDVIPLLLGACPSYADSAEAASHDERNGHYVGMEYFVTHLIRLLDEGDTDAFPEVFAMVEMVLLEGDGPARGLITYGFLQDLRSPNLFYQTSVEPNDFLPWIEFRARRERNVRRLLHRRRRPDPPA
jgi:hypothetical protein